MIKAKALCMVPDIQTPEILPYPPIPAVLETQQAQPSSPVIGVSYSGIEGILAKKQDFIIESSEKQEAIPDYITNLALRLVQKDPLMKPFIRKLRQQYIEQQKAFSFSLAAWSPAERKEICEFFSEELCGIVGSVAFDRNHSVLTGNLVLSTPARNFLTGEYMEIGVTELIRQAMEEMTNCQHIPYQLYRNVVVSTKDGYIKNEFDIVIECQGLYYVVEVKSGANFNSWDKPREIGKTYGIVPHRLLLVDSYLTEEKAGRIEHFCEYYVSNLETEILKGKVIEMVGNDLRKEYA